MKKTLFGILLTGLAASVSATPVTFQDVYNPADLKLTAGTNSSSLTFTHDILDNGFLPSSHTISSAKLSLNLADDDEDRYFLIFPINHEYATVSGDNILLTPQQFEVDGSRQFTVSSALLQHDGKLKVTVSAISGDFTFKSSTLDVDAVAAVPEPGTMALMALGLLGLGAVARRRK